jgi:hypothetical protein
MAVAPEGKKILEKIFNYLNTPDAKKSVDDFEIYDINLVDDTKPYKIYMNITTILKEYPDIMILADVSSQDYKDFSKELKEYVLDDSITNKSFCDLILYDIICSMRLNEIIFIKYDDKIKINKSLDTPILFGDKTIVYSSIDVENFIKEANVTKSIKIINGFIENFTIPMGKKIKLYKILNLFLTKIYDTANANNTILLNMFKKIIDPAKMACAPRTIIYGLLGGYNNKSGDIDYHICKANFKQTFKKVSAKSAREGAKMVAMKVLKDKKKSIKFTLKRMIGKKEKCYDYDVSIDKKGKIIIKNQS